MRAPFVRPLRGGGMYDLLTVAVWWRVVVDFLRTMRSHF
jgi:hypothetical protein